jgi:DNA sulfur modification protein DndD
MNYTKTKKNWNSKGKELENKFNQLSEIIPFAVSAGKLEEVTEHLAKQEEDSSLQEKRNELIEKNNQLLEKLFNNPPFLRTEIFHFQKKCFMLKRQKKLLKMYLGKLKIQTSLILNTT